MMSKADGKMNPETDATDVESIEIVTAEQARQRATDYTNRRAVRLAEMAAEQAAREAAEKREDEQ